MPGTHRCSSSGAGYRVIAHDRRGHGRSTRPGTATRWTLTWTTSRRYSKRSNLRRHHGGPFHRRRRSRTLSRPARHQRVAKAVLIGAVPPLMLKTDKNPGGFRSRYSTTYVRGSPAIGRSSKGLTLPFYGYNRPGAKISEGIREHWWLQGMLGGMKAHYDCIKAFSETDFTEDLKKIDIPVLVMHGDDDQIVPIAAAGRMSAKILKKATLKVYPGYPHGMPSTNPDQINADLLAFFKGSAAAAAR